MFLKEKPYNIGLRWLLIIVWDTLCLFGAWILVFSSVKDWIGVLVAFLISFVSISLFLLLKRYI